MADLLLDKLPQQFEGYDIDPDFRPMCWLSNQLLRGAPDNDPLGFARQLCRRFFRCSIADSELTNAFAVALRFYAAADAPRRESGRSSAGNYTALFDYETDAAYLVAAFQQVYGIDLTADRVHWWRFRALFSALPEDTRLSQIIEIRRKDLSKISDPEMRQRYEQLQEIYALPQELKGGAPRIATVAEHNAAFLARLAPGG